MECLLLNVRHCLVVFLKAKQEKRQSKNIQEAIQGYLESLETHDEPIPPPIKEEIIDIAV